MNDLEVMNGNLSIVIPAYNEEESLLEYLPQVILECQRNNWKLIIVDDGSKDNTYYLLKQNFQSDFLTVIRHKLNRGYGGALKSGIEAVNTEYVITMDADGQHRISDVHNMYHIIKERDADLVVGRRLFKGNLYRTIGKKLILFFAKRLMPVPIEDLNTGMKIYRTKLAQDFLKNRPNSMAFSDIMALLFINSRHLVIEIPIQLNDRKFGQSSVSTRTAFTTLYEILNIVLMFNPIRIFLPSGLLFILIGIAWGIPIALAHRGISIGASLSISVGIIIIFFGLIAEQISQIRKQL